MRHRHRPEPRQARAFPSTVIFGAIALGTGYYVLQPSSKSTCLNQDTFAPYTITAREAISPTSFIITTTPENPASASTYLDNHSSWRWPLWSVEFKQPEVQIARHYTPLPQDPVSTASGQLQFYIRAINGGEMSTYLNRLQQGSQVHLRGPHKGFDVAARLGSKCHVVFLAGGTGVVPGLQVARATLGSNPDSTFTLLWAIRQRGELQNVPPPQKPWWQSLWTRKAPSEVDIVDQPSAVGRQLQSLKSQFGDRMHIQVAVDEEKTFYTLADIQKSITAADTNTTTALVPAPGTESACAMHHQRLHSRVSEFEEQPTPCVCDIPSGKNLFMVSGPEGFVSHFAGPKVWLNGVETQGPVGGVAAQLQQTMPRLASEWLVLKL